jgi:DNA-binding MarR family transcriptional regulator
MSPPRPRRSRAQILDELAGVGRENSDATVLFHSTIASLLDLHATDYKALGILERLGPRSAGQISEQSGLAPASVTNLIDRLEQKGFVRRVPDPADRRRVMVEPVRDRIAGAGRLFTSTRRSLAKLWERYSDSELVVIADFLGRNAERLRIETTKLSSNTAPAAAAGAAGRRRRVGQSTS